MKSKDDDMKVLLKQPYFVTMAKHDFNVHESRVFLKVIKSLQPKMVYDKSPFEIKKDELGHLEIKVQAKDLVKSGNYDDVRRALKHLTKKEIVVEERNEKGEVTSELFTNLLMAGELEYRSSICNLLVHKKIVPHLIGLNKNYTQYLYQPAFNSSSPNTMKLYMMCAHFREKKQINVNLDTLKDLLRIDNKYNRVYDIKKWILSPAMRELKAKADVWFDIAERIKDGRRMIGWKFNIYTKKEPDKKLPKPTKANAEAPAKKLSATEKRLQEQFHLSPKQSAKVTKAVKKDDLAKAMYDMKLVIMNDKVMNIGGYAATFLSKRFDIKL